MRSEEQEGWWSEERAGRESGRTGEERKHRQELELQEPGRLKRNKSQEDFKATRANRKDHGYND